MEYLPKCFSCPIQSQCICWSWRILIYLTTLCMMIFHWRPPPSMFSNEWNVEKVNEMLPVRYTLWSSWQNISWKSTPWMCACHFPLHDWKWRGCASKPSWVLRNYWRSELHWGVWVRVTLLECWGSFYAVIVALLCLLLKIDLKELFTWLDNRNRYWLPIWPFSATGQKMLVTTKIR